jgi:PEP-CTERM motif
MLKYGLAAIAVALVTPTVASATDVLTLNTKFTERRNLPRAIRDPVEGSNVAEPSAFVLNSPSSAPLSLVRGFEGTSDYDSRALGSALIPPDTMGAVGTTQYVQLINGSFSVYSKATGALLAPRITDSNFWTSIGGGATGGDPRVLFDNRTNRWLAIGFDGSGANIRIAVSQTDALGAWKSAVVTGVSGSAFPLGGLADYPTLSLSGNSVLIGTNDFARNPAGSPSAFSFRGTTLNVLNRSDIFSATGPDVSGLVKFETRGPFNTLDKDRGFAIQGVNSDSFTSTATVVSASLFFLDNISYNVQNAGAANATQSAQFYLSDRGGSLFDDTQPARQPVNGANARVLDSLDTRISANAWEVKGRIYFVNTVTPTGTDNTVVRITVMDKATGNVLSETDLNDPSGAFDFYQGSIAVNKAGQLVVGYNRSGDVTTGQDGRVSVFARGFKTNADGTLTAMGDAVLLKQSVVDEYHNGSPIGQAAVGRQRWGDYSAVNVDPLNMQSFWITGQFAREYNTLANHPNGNGSGFARWGTYIAEVNLNSVPEPGTWLMMVAGFGFVGVSMRRRTAATVAA